MIIVVNTTKKIMVMLGVLIDKKIHEVVINGIKYKILDSYSEYDHEFELDIYYTDILLKINEDKSKEYFILETVYDFSGYLLHKTLYKATNVKKRYTASKGDIVITDLGD